ncbi:YARHG domain-containing protein [Tenacibaculum sp. SDUM215027]|uniref:YARHG domain-containing protein n=1 Tax=Tenacibaculum sp. SDUM215027 TaxID=3422596 RepID=UPI003D3208F0
MIDRIIKILMLLVFIVNVNGQSSKVWQGVVYPKDLDTFLQGEYTTIEGNLEIYKTSLTNLAQLKSLKVVKGNVYIGIYDYKRDLEEGNESLTSLEGLDNLTEVSGELVIRDNESLDNIDALKKLKKVHQLNISYNPMLKSIEGLSNLSGELLGGLQVYKNKRLQDISQLSGITLVGQHLIVSSNLSIRSLEGLHNIKAVKDGYLGIRSNANLKDLKGLRKLSTVDEEVQINSNPLIESLEGLEKLTAIGKFLYIKQNNNLKNLEGLKSLKSIGKDFDINKNNKLTSLNGLKKLITVKGDLRIIENPLLNDINGVNTLKDTINTIAIYKNESLKEITGLNNIAVVKENVSLSKNSLENVTGFNGLKNIGESLSLTLNHLKFLNGFESLTTVEDFGIGTDLDVIDLTNSFIKLTQIKKGFFLRSEETLVHFSGPNSIVKIGKITITDNEKLESLSGFNGLKTVTEGVQIKDNKLLKIVEGFNRLKTINGRFDIEDNPVLKGIKGFKNINFIDYLWIDENRKLSNLSGFNNLKSANKIYLRRNYAIEDLTGFSSLEKVNEELDLHNLSELKSLNGLENLMFIGKQLDFTNNSKLIDYSALQVSFIKSITNKHLWISNNGYNPYKNRLLIHDRLNTSLIPEEYLKPLNRWWLSLLRNEIFARKGFAFGNQELTDFFSDMGWYQPEEGVEIVLNDIEEENVRLIKMYEQKRIDIATGAIQSLKNKHQDNIDFPSNYEKYYPILRKFIKSIDAKSVSKSNKLTFSIATDIDKNVLGEDIESINSDVVDNISIHFNHKEKALHIIIEDNRLEENEYDSWLTQEIIDFQFKIKDDFTIDFSHATGEYN